jgi:hypothetical protein
MRQNVLTAALAAAALLTGSQASAQAPYQRPQLGPMQRPTVSPYLNLARGGSKAINYHGLVRPQVETTRAITQLQQQQQTLLQPMAPLGQAPPTDLPITGRPVQFWNYGTYFPTMPPPGTPPPPPPGMPRR